MSFLEQAFELAVTFRAIDALTGPVTRMAGSLGILDERTRAVQARLNNFRNMAFVGGAMTIAGAVMAKGLISAADKAGELQTSLMGVKNALGMTNQEYQKAMNLSQTVGIPTIFSATEVGGIMQAMGTSGLTKDQVLNSGILQQYVNFADVQKLQKKENAPDAVASAVKMAHQYQLYSTAQISPFLNQLNAALLHTHDTASEFSTTFKYISNQSRSMGLNSGDALATTAWLSRMGFGNGRGGTNFADFLQRSIYHSSGKKADKAMQTAGFVTNGHSVFEDAKGNFVGIPEAVKIMQDFSKRFGGNANTMNPLLKDIFGTQGARVAMMMSTSGASEQYTAVQKQIQGSPSINTMQEDQNKTWQGQTRQAATTLQDIWTNFGFGVQQSMLPVLEGLNNILGKILEFEQAHPEVVKWIATFTEIAAAVLLVVGPITLLAGVLGYLKEAKIVSAGFSLMKTAVGGVAGPVLGLIAAGYLLYQAWTHDWGGIKEKTKAVTDWIGKEIPKAVKSVKDFAKDLGLIDDKGHFSETVQWLGKIALGIIAAKGAFDIMKLAVLGVNLVMNLNPWVLAITSVITVVAILATNWDKVKAAIDGAREALGKFFNTSNVQQKQTENAYTSFYNNPNYVPNNPNGTIAQSSSPGILGSIGNGLSTFRSWVQGKAYATGTNYAPGGWSLVGENGPEIVNLPRGSQVIPNGRLGGTGNTVINIYPQPGQSAREIAQEVARELGLSTRTNNMSRSMGANRLVFG
ncbi:phage tail tape measure protein [Desulfosporosinus sp. FKA]|uniref:phage tail tape measure protein n=1 Tax=Desulfosporosinus sp. FKA TaxID=1969834 RepID=UPI000B4976E3|nr:phage tail tape measure protein [Desulfosporosinus sp. FKA]